MWHRPPENMSCVLIVCCVQHAPVDSPLALAPGGIPAAILGAPQVGKTEANLVRSTLGGLRERVNNDGHSRSLYHPQCIVVVQLVQDNTSVVRCQKNSSCSPLKANIYTSMQVFSMICKKHYSAKPTTGS